MPGLFVTCNLKNFGCKAQEIILVLAAMLTAEHFADASKMISIEEEKRAG